MNSGHLYAVGSAGARPDDGPARPSVTVLIPARNEERWIGSTLESVLRQSWVDLEVLVIDSGSADGTAEVVNAFAARDPRVRLLANTAGTIPTALNTGLAHARGTYLVRVDAHSTVPAEYVERAVDLLRSGDWGGVGGRKDAVASTRTGRAIAVALGSPFGVGDSAYHYVTAPRLTDHVPFGAYPVALCRQVGGWDETVLTNEDYEFDYRLRSAGHELLLDPRLRIEWRCRETVRDLARQYWRYGRGKAAVARKHPQSLRPRHLAAPALVALMAGAAILATRRPQWALALCAPYVVVNGVVSASTSSPDPRTRVRLPVVFAAMHLSWGSGFWAGVLFDRRPPAPDRVVAPRR